MLNKKLFNVEAFPFCQKSQTENVINLFNQTKNKVCKQNQKNNEYIKQNMQIVSINIISVNV